MAGSKKTKETNERARNDAYEEIRKTLTTRYYGVKMPASVVVPYLTHYEPVLMEVLATTFVKQTVTRVRKVRIGKKLLAVYKINRKCYILFEHTEGNKYAEMLFSHCTGKHTKAHIAKKLFHAGGSAAVTSDITWKSLPSIGKLYKKYADEQLKESFAQYVWRKSQKKGTKIAHEIMKARELSQQHQQDRKQQGRTPFNTITEKRRKQINTLSQNASI